MKDPRIQDPVRIKEYSMKSETIAAVAALATTMFLSQGTMAQDQADQANRPADASKQVDTASPPTKSV